MLSEGEDNYGNVYAFAVLILVLMEDALGEFSSRLDN